MVTTTTVTTQFSIRTCRCPPRPEANGPGLRHAIGPPVSLFSVQQLHLPNQRFWSRSNHLPRTIPEKSPSKRHRRRKNMEAKAVCLPIQMGGSACIVLRIRRRSGGLGPWAQKHYAMLVEWGINRGDLCPSTDPLRARHLCWLSIQILTVRCLSLGDRRKWQWPNSNNSCSSIIRTWILM